jgi:DNA-binding NarL/FixJ family response regulator
MLLVRQAHQGLLNEEVSLKTRMRILVAVRSEGLARVIFHLLANIQDVDAVCSVADPTRIVHYAERVLPHLIIANSCDLNSVEAIHKVKTASPGVKLILTLWEDAACFSDRECGEDARITEDSLVDQLVPTVLRLSDLSPSQPQGRTGSSRIARRRFQ